MSVPQTLYHYTSKRSADLIVDSGRLRSSASGEGGRGVYLTNCAPNSSRETLLEELRHGGLTKVHAYVIIRSKYLREAGYDIRKVPGTRQWVVKPFINLNELPNSAWDVKDFNY